MDTRSMSPPRTPRVTVRDHYSSSGGVPWSYQPVTVIVVVGLVLGLRRMSSGGGQVRGWM
jgi:hypothetical protein